MVDETLVAVHHAREVEAELGVEEHRFLGAAVTAMAKVGGATRSRYPAARAAAGSWHSGLVSPIAAANSRIFSAPTR